MGQACGDKQGGCTGTAETVPRMGELGAYLGFLHLHDVSLAVCNAVIDIVDVGSQGLYLLAQAVPTTVLLTTLLGQLLPSFPELFTSPGQLFPLLLRKRQDSGNGALEGMRTWHFVNGNGRGEKKGG